MFQNVLTTPEALPARRPDRPGGTKPQTPLPASPPRQGSRLPQSVWRQRRLRHVHRAGAESFSQGRPSIGYPTTTAPDLIGVKPTGPVVKCPAKAAFGWPVLRTNATAGGAVVTGARLMTRPPQRQKRPRHGADVVGGQDQDLLRQGQRGRKAGQHQQIGHSGGRRAGAARRGVRSQRHSTALVAGPL